MARSNLSIGTSFVEYLLITGFALLLGFSALRYILEPAKQILDHVALQITTLVK